MSVVFASVSLQNKLPRPIDDEDTAIFCDRWAAMLALVAQGDYDATRDTYRRLISPT